MRIIFALPENWVSWPTSVIFRFDFLMLHHWLGSQEGFLALNGDNFLELV
jgi:hypothetical protein